MARGDEEESERLTATCPAETTCAGTGHVRVCGRGQAPGQDKSDSCLSRHVPYLSTTWQDDVHWAYFDGHMAGSRYAWNRSGRAGEPPGWEADEEEAERNADPSIDEDLQKSAGEGRYTRLEGKLQEMERELVREALTAWLGFACFCAQEMGLKAEELLEALAGPLAERLRDLEELSARHEVEPEAEGVEEYLAIMTEAWHRGLESA